MVDVLNGAAQRTPIDGWVIVISEGKQLVGLPARTLADSVSGDPLGGVPFELAPAWSYALMQAQTLDGQVGVVVRLEPVLRLLSVKRLHLHRALLIADVDALSKHERMAILQAYDVLQEEIMAVTAAQAGIVRATSIPRAQRQ